MLADIVSNFLLQMVFDIANCQVFQTERMELFLLTAPDISIDTLELAKETAIEKNNHPKGVEKAGQSKPKPSSEQKKKKKSQKLQHELKKKAKNTQRQYNMVMKNSTCSVAVLFLLFLATVTTKISFCYAFPTWGVVRVREKRHF